MSKPWVHAESSARKWGGKPDDYMPIHNLMDSSKGAIADSRHRALTHNSWFIGPDGPLEKIFGINITNSDGRLVSVRDIGEQHILEDFGNRFIPSAQDYLQEIEFKEWMLQGKGSPPSFAKLYRTKTEDLEADVQRLTKMVDRMTFDGPNNASIYEIKNFKAHVTD
jgi:hypothetical protein